MATEPRRKGETPRERGLRMAQAVWDQQPAAVKARTRRPGSLRHGSVHVRRTRKRGGAQTWASMAEPKGFIR